jgi:Predicted SAM-dependent RNA methyltransferase
MRTLLGPDSRLHFTNLSQASADSLNAILHSDHDDDSLLSTTSCHTIGVMDFVKGSGEIIASLDEICLLDPKAQVPLTPQDGDGRFKWFLFGVRSFDSARTI